MPAYQFTAQDQTGAVQKGVIEADTPRLARSILRGRQWIPLDIVIVSEKGLDKRSHRQLGWRRGLSNAQLSLMTRQLATLLAAGLTIEQSLNALIEQTDHELTRQVVAGVRSSVLAGNPLHQALAEYPKTFPDIYRALVSAGEQSGELDQVMLKLADYTESRHGLQQRLILAFIYPAIVTLVAAGVIIGLMTYVVPQIVGVFQRSHQALPVLTRMLIGASDFLKAWGVYLVVIIIAAIYGGRYALRNPQRRLAWHRFLLEMPIFGRLIRTLGSARFASTLAILVGSGVPLLQALRTGGEVVGNQVMRNAVVEATNMVREGASLGRSLGRERVFPPVLIHLISSGESSGKLDFMLEKAAIQQENEVGNRVAMMTGMLEPLLIVLMGGVVLVIVLAILLPIINVNQVLR